MPLRKTVPAAITGLLSGFFAHGAVATTSFNTSYGPVPVSSTGVGAGPPGGARPPRGEVKKQPAGAPAGWSAARFAATTKSVEIKTILKAQQAATANLHFIICMRVADTGRAYLVETKVSRASGKPYNLDAWAKVKTCK